MKKITLILITTIFLTSFIDREKMVGKKVPVFKRQTLNSMTVDTSFFKNKVTLITFMYLGCKPCMYEARQLEKLYEEFKNTDFQILCIAPHTADQLKDFNSDSGSDLANLRTYFKIDKLKYQIIPECDMEDPKRKKIDKDGSTIIAPECNTISKLFKFNGYPQTFLIDKLGIIRISESGFSINSTDTSAMVKMRRQIKELLKSTYS